jgi:hypothetical protein
MDGTLDPVNLMWKNENDIAAPLNSNAAGELVCPLCARLGRTAVLRSLRQTGVHVCDAGHEFRPAPLI